MPTDTQSQPSTGLLRATFGFTEFRPGQADAIGSLIDGQHTLVVMPTGAGKSLVYQYAAIARAGTTVVVSPLISLMQDQVDSLTRRKIAAAFINSSLPSAEQVRRLEAMSRGEYRLVYVAPERLRNVGFRDAMRTANVTLLAVDEAHCISQWGHDFRPDYLNIADSRREMGDPLTVALTATATPRVREDIAARLNLDPVNSVVTGFNRANLTFRVISTRDDEAKLRALAKAVNGLKDGAAIIYVGTRRDAEEVAEFITDTTGKPCKFYHGGMPADDRARTQDEFMSGRIPVVAATNAFGMGIDRSDVRMVIHHTIPSSLEEYYQEAGRAGRDGRPALVALLYSPRDRSLQEFFIDNSKISLDDLRSLHREVKSKAGGITSDDLSLALGMNEIAIRVALAQLETAGIARLTSTDGPRWFVKANEWNQSEALSAVGRASAHLAAKREQLDHMIDYAESDHCRRRIILDHFADPASPDSVRCCDNCLSQNKGQTPISAPETESEEQSDESTTAHAILDTVRLIQWGIGVGKLVKLLAGSNAKSIGFASYKNNPHFGRLAGLNQEEIGGLIDQLIDLGYLKPIGGDRPVLKLSPRGTAALETQSPVPLKLPRRLPKQAKPRRNSDGKENTFDLTAQLYESGMKPEQIAAERGLNIVTIEGHLARLVANGRANLDELVSPENAELIRQAINQIGDISRLNPIKAALPESISYGHIQCVLAADGHWPQNKGQTPISVTEPDAVSDYLSKSHPKPLRGTWRCGWSLGFHSSFAGSDWNRSGVGQLAYQLKYQADANAVAPLVCEAMALMKKHPDLADVDAIVPVPPTMKREFDPVTEFAKALADELEIAVLPVVEKVQQTKPQKEMRTMAQKRANVRDAFAVKQNVTGGKLLLVDDLFDSGATLEEAHRVLKLAGATRVAVLTLTRTIHSDS